MSTKALFLVIATVLTLGGVYFVLHAIFMVESDNWSEERPMPQPREPRALQFIAAGVPQTPDVRESALAVFNTLATHNIHIFFPTFQTHELPEVRSLGYEEDFLLPCNEPRPIHDTLRTAGVKLLIPGEPFYNRNPLPPIEDDLLAQLVKCLGREHIAGVASYDEPVHTDVPLERVREMYQRVKEIDPSLPVFMVHAPVRANTDGSITEHERQRYLT